MTSQAINYTVPGWIYGSTMCPLLHFFNVWTMSVSIFTMCSLALMRFAGLVLPFRFKNSSQAMSGGIGRVTMTCILWATGGILASPNLVHFRVMTSKYQRENQTLVPCLHFSSSDPGAHCAWPDQRSHDAYWTVLVTCTYVIPLIMVSTLYILITVEVVCFMKKKDER